MDDSGDSLPGIEKLTIIETYWSSLSANPEPFESPEWHKDELRKTEAEFANGKVEVLDWTEAKKNLRKRFDERRESVLDSSDFFSLPSP